MSDEALLFHKKTAGQACVEETILKEGVYTTLRANSDTPLLLKIDSAIAGPS